MSAVKTARQHRCWEWLGHSSVFAALVDAIVSLAKEKGVKFDDYPNTRLHSILEVEGAVHCRTVTRRHPEEATGEHTGDAAWLVMPRYALDPQAVTID